MNLTKKNSELAYRGYMLYAGDEDDDPKAKTRCLGFLLYQVSQIMLRDVVSGNEQKCPLVYFEFILITE